MDWAHISSHTSHFGPFMKSTSCGLQGQVYALEVSINVDNASEERDAFGEIIRLFIDLISIFNPFWRYTLQDLRNLFQ